MHPTTAAVRAMYERFPYPAGPVTLRMGFDVRRLRSFVDADRATDGPIRVLDAGCGRGSGLLGMAAAQPDVQFLGIDLNRVALDEVRAQAAARGLANVQAAEVDLETLEGLEVPEDGFDVIVSSGVVHHLIDPAAALRRLAECLAPWGVIDLMVYARPGRVGIEEVAAFIAETVPAGPADERLRAARAVIADRPESAFAEARAMNDIEFVDRYLHPLFVSYELAELKTLIEDAGLELRRWTDPTQLPVAPTDADPWHHAQASAPTTRPMMWNPLLTRPDVGARKPVRGAAIDQATWALNPEGTLSQAIRTLWTGARQTPMQWTPAAGRTIEFGGALAPVGEFLARIGEPFTGAQLLSFVARRGLRADPARSLLLQLEDHDVLWRPHASDLEARRPAVRAA